MTFNFTVLAPQGPGVSHKIQQLLNTLKRPKKNRKPIEQYYTEDTEADSKAKGCIEYMYQYMCTYKYRCMYIHM